MEKVNTSAIIRQGKDFSLKFENVEEFEEVIRHGKSFLNGMDQILVLAVVNSTLLRQIVEMRSSNNDFLKRMSITLDLKHDYSESAQILAKAGRTFRSLRIADEKDF